MKKGRLQQRTLDSYFKPTAAPSTPVAPSPYTANVAASAGVQVEVMNEILHRAPAPAPTTAAPGCHREQPWLGGKETVVFPWSPVVPRAGSDGQQAQSWDAIQRVLRESTPVHTSADLCDLLRSLQRVVDGEGSSFAHLRRTLDAMPPAEQQHVYQAVVPWMTETVLQAPHTLAGRTLPLPLLVQGTTRRLVLSHEEVVLLMCCCFFSVFPQRFEPRRAPADGRTAGAGQGQAPFHRVAPRGLSATRKLPSCNFSSLFSCTASGRDACIAGKIRCFLDYFVCCQRHHGQPSSPAHKRCLELTRVCTTELPVFEDSARPLCDVSLCRSGGIEEDAGSLQVDFANRFVGGGVLRSGCVQEEIRMALAPEMVVSRVVCEELADTEVLFISGAPNFSCAVGYAEAFRHRGSCDPWGPQKEDALGTGVAAAPPLVDAAAPHPRTGAAMLMHDVCVLAMDAYNFRVCGEPTAQFQLPFLHREVRKAYVGFHGVAEPLATLPVVRRGAVATGNWGCGAFCGDVELKLVLQWCAASEAGGRTLHYYTFGKPMNDFDALVARLRADGCTVGRLMRALAQYSRFRDAVPSASTPLSPLEYLAEHTCTTEVS